MTLFRNKYRIQSARLKDYDYSQIGAYFITICTKNHYPYFGKIENNKVSLTDIGKTASQFWQEIPSHFPHVLLDETIIMPNHIHGIIIIDKIQNEIKTDDLTELSNNNSISSKETPKLDKNNLISPVETPKSVDNDLISSVETPKLGVSTSWKKGTIGVIINQYKRICTLTIKNINPLFAWQPRFYDHIIRNEKDLNRIRQYIFNNPIDWTKDEYFC